VNRCWGVGNMTWVPNRMQVTGFAGGVAAQVTGVVDMAVGMGQDALTSVAGLVPLHVVVDVTGVIL
jgi:hypothetical protein